MAGSINIQVDVKEVVEEFSLSKLAATGLTKKVVSDVTQLILRNWRAQAKMELGSTRKQYLAGLQIIESGAFQNTIVLMGTLPNMLEFGASAFDMKEGFSKSSKRKFSDKTGKWYLTIPFRHATPTALGESEVFSSVLPTEVYNAIKKTVSESRTKAGGGKIGGGGLKAINIPSPFDAIQSRASITENIGNVAEGKLKEYMHKNNIYEGITKSSKEYESATQSTYVSFRRVSENSDENSWIHRGLRAHDLANKAIDASDVQTQVDNSIDEYLDALGFGSKA